MNKILCLCLLVAAAAHAQGVSGPALGPLADFNMQLFPGTAWTTPITTAAVDPSSAAWVKQNGGFALHPDFDNGTFGIPYIIVNSVTQKIPYVVAPPALYGDESDIVAAPIPANMPIEMAPNAPAPCQSQQDYTGDHHANVYDVATGFVTEYYEAIPCRGKWSSAGSAVWDVTSTKQQRPWSFTSVDAAGLSVLAGLVTYEQAYTHPVMQPLDGAMVPTLGHAIRFTMGYTRCDHYVNGDGVGGYILPATHSACNNGGTLNIMGMRIRLKSTFDCAQFSAGSLVMCNTMKIYGMILADNGSNLFFQGTPDPRWQPGDYNALKSIRASEFEVTTIGKVYTDDTLPKGEAPVNTTPTASATNIILGQCTTLSWTSTGSTYDYLQHGNPVRILADGPQSTVECPQTSTTYAVVSNNQFGRTTSPPVTVTVVFPRFIGVGPVGVR